MKDEELTKTIIGCAFHVHNTLGAGFLEQVYENALRIELAKQGLQVKQQAPIEVYHDGQTVGCYYADLWVEDRVIVELKAVRQLSKAHEVQLVNYLTATGRGKAFWRPRALGFQSRPRRAPLHAR